MTSREVARCAACAGASALVSISAYPQGPAPGGEIVIGQTIALSGSLAEHGQAVSLGARAYFDRVNARGGINGRRIVVKTLDDAGNAGRAAENPARLIREDNAVAIFGGVGGGPCVASMKVAVSSQVPLVACLAGSPEPREPFNRYVFPVRAPHLAEFERLIDHALEFKRSRIGFLHADNKTGQRHLANVKKILARHGAALAAAIPIPNKDPDARRLAQAIAAARLDVVFNHGSYALYGEIIKQLKRDLPEEARLTFLAVNSGAEQLSKLLGPDARGLIVTQVVPYPWRSTPEVVREHRDDLRAIAPDASPSFSSLEGYVGARVLVEGLRRAGPRPSRESLAQSLERLGALDLGGYVVRYRPDSREGSTFVDMVMATGTGRFAH
jgi:ABC-type branched-subunit amino acid transport system substrate-binding protein